ncbi:MAG: T9SS type A sorting domain-containing protein [Candidatus Neomarinimicrobiota bacterium]
MKTIKPAVLFSLIFICVPLFAGSPDLILQKDITPEYIIYLSSKEAKFLLQTAIGSDDTPTMKAHMGLAIIEAAWDIVNQDTLFTNTELLLDDIGSNLSDIGFIAETDIFPILQSQSQQEFFTLLTDFFNNGTYPAFRDTMKTRLFNIGGDINQIGTEIAVYQQKADEIYSAFGDHWEMVRDGTADFEFSVSLAGTKYETTPFIFSRKFFNRLDEIDQLTQAMGHSFDSGFSNIDSVMSIPNGDVMPGVANVRTGLDQTHQFLDTLKVLLTNQPFQPLNLNLAPFDSVKMVISEIDTLLNGKVYPVGDPINGKTIKPLAILQNMPANGLKTVFYDYYRNGEFDNFSFNDIFPNGAPENLLLMIRSDVVFNTNDDFLTFRACLSVKKAEWLAMNPIPPDKHFGIAMALTVKLLTNKQIHENFNRAFYCLQTGRIDSLTYLFDWKDFDFSPQIAEIRNHIDFYIHSVNPTNFVIIEKHDDVIVNRYNILANSDFSVDPFSASVPNVHTAVNFISLLGDGLMAINSGFRAIYQNLNEVFVLDLDPTKLNFSEVQSDSDFILILESSNPDFLSLTPYGVEKFHEAGAWFSTAFDSLAIFSGRLTDLFTAMAPYEDDFNMDSEKMIMYGYISHTFADMIHTDFEYPDSMMNMGNERLNLSAWFDNPPKSFLLMWKNLVFGVDSTLGGLFPDRYKSLSSRKLPTLPREFCLYPVYPNPFNPVAHIEFDLPAVADVKISILNLQGRVVEQIVNQRFRSGKHIVPWNAVNFSSGIYFARLEVNGNISIRKMSLIK